MALTIPWKKKLADVELSGFEGRDVVWAWYYLKKYNLNFEFSPFDSLEKSVHEIVDTIGKYQSYRFQELREYKKNRIVPLREFSFVENEDLRMINYLFHQLETKLNTRVEPEWYIASMTYKQIIQLAFDLHDQNATYKLKVLNNIRESYSENLEIGRSLIWIDEKDEAQSFWLSEMACQFEFPEPILKALNSPTNAKQRVLRFKAMFDQYECSRSVKKSIANEIKRSWNNKKKSDDTSKTQFNVLLNPETKDHIKILKIKLGVRSQSDVIEQLVHDAMKSFHN